MRLDDTLSEPVCPVCQAPVGRSRISELSLSLSLSPPSPRLTIHCIIVHICSLLDTHLYLAFNSRLRHQGQILRAVTCELNQLLASAHSCFVTRPAGYSRRLELYERASFSPSLLLLASNIRYIPILLVLRSINVTSVNGFIIHSAKPYIRVTLLYYRHRMLATSLGKWGHWVPKPPECGFVVSWLSGFSNSGTTYTYLVIYMIPPDACTNEHDDGPSFRQR